MQKYVNKGISSSLYSSLSCVSETTIALEITLGIIQKTEKQDRNEIIIIEEGAVV